MNAESAFLFESRAGAAVASIQLSELTSSVIESLQEEMAEATGPGERAQLVLELSKVKFIDSVALGALVVLLRRLKEGNGRLALVGLSGHCLNVMQVTGMDRVFDLHGDVASALEAFKRPA